MSSSRPLSQASTATNAEKRDSSAPLDPIDEKLDPWLVSFGPDDPDNPLVRSAFSARLSPLRVPLSQRLDRTGPDGNGGT
jgi:hypothetical protein